MTFTAAEIYKQVSCFSKSGEKGMRRPICADSGHQALFSPSPKKIGAGFEAIASQAQRSSNLANCTVLYSLVALQVYKCYLMVMVMKCHVIIVIITIGI